MKLYWWLQVLLVLADKDLDIADWPIAGRYKLSFTTITVSFLMACTLFSTKMVFHTLSWWCSKRVWVFMQY
jgi:hypothetical protein